MRLLTATFLALHLFTTLVMHVLSEEPRTLDYSQEEEPQHAAKPRT